MKVSRVRFHEVFHILYLPANPFDPNCSRRTRSSGFEIHDSQAKSQLADLAAPKLEVAVTE